MSENVEEIFYPQTLAKNIAIKKIDKINNKNPEVLTKEEDRKTKINLKKVKKGLN
ncbi:MAG: hypothetical protein HRK26_05660 [Rickettsiaceae bacterium H1]|nr:hypothetical protein [Rickettsiaceae bacterium H1]